MAGTPTTEEVRADGPTAVVKGPDSGPLVVVLDPCGDAKHEELPATWRPITEDVGVLWYRLPSARRTGRTSDRLLIDLPGHHDRVHLVGADGAALLTLSLAVAHRDLVRSVILVDPPWRDHEVAELRRIINDPELILHQVRTTSNGTPDTLPIGHPDVVRAVVRALVAADAEAEVENDTSPPGAEALAPAAWRALRTKLTRLLDTLGG